MIDYSKKRIFVFGSNTAGIHGAGAALHAKKHYGALPGFGIGHMGRCYAIPTKDHNLVRFDLPTIEGFVRGFKAYAAEQDGKLEFNVTRIGTGLAGYSDREIAHMFKDSPPNCFFDIEWRHWLINISFWDPPI